MIKKVLIWPDPKLRKASKEVTVFDEKLTQLIIDLHQTMKEYDNKPHLPDCAGLAAPQIGVHQRVFVYKMKGEGTCMINPVILEQEGEQYESEGCLSFPGVFIKVHRANRILVEFQDVDGNKNRLRTDGFVSRIIQHEINHLDGVTYLHALSQVKRDLITRKLKKVQKRVAEQERQFNEWKQRMFAEADSGNDNPGGDTRGSSETKESL